MKAIPFGPVAGLFRFDNSGGGCYHQKKRTGEGKCGVYRIFIVEDDPIIAGAVQRHLEGWGYQVACAARFNDVLSEFAAYDP